VCGALTCVYGSSHPFPPRGHHEDADDDHYQGGCYADHRQMRTIDAMMMMMIY
jgi:hypothetical protein